MNELLAHLVGDYCLQSDWMAQNKVKAWLPAIAHAACYTLPFLFLTLQFLPLAVICLTHLLIDRFRLAAYVSKLKNWNWDSPNGYDADRPVWLTTWLIIITDNTMHLLINHMALIYL